MRLPKRKSEQRRKYSDDDRYLTPKRIREMQDEISRLRDRIRPKAVEDLTQAREMGDLSENAAYSYAKGRLAGIDRRLFELGERVKNAIPIKSGAGTDGRISIGATVTVEVNGRTRTFEITGSQETDPGSGRISYRSPVGAALLNHRAGDSATAKNGDWEIEYKIISVE